MNTLYLVCTNGVENNLAVCNKINCSAELSTLENLSDYDKQYYNDEVRNEIEIREDQLDALLNIINDKSIAVELNAKNIQDIFLWSRNKFAVVLTLHNGNFEYDHYIDVNNTTNILDDLGLV